MKIIPCDSRYAEPILDILNDAILHSTALYDYTPRTLDDMKTWFETKTKNNFPVVGIVDDHDKLLGFGSYGTFRGWPAYKYTVEHSLYIRKDNRGKGLGKIILREIIQQATHQDYHCLIAGIDSTNEVSVALHRQFGFEYCGTIQQAGFKFNTWLDLAFYQLILKTPLHPTED
jgi:phosphinothricin acetyltransferase